VAAAVTAVGQEAKPQAAARRPNVIVIITDDQGYGDLSCHGNPILKTPHLDRLAKEGVQLTQFYVSPVCSPTRASLLTGRYNYRTGVVDTFLGRSMMHTDEVTLTEMLRGAGYRTGIFGKWHLGDNYPMRPTDQGFEESLVIKGGGLGQPSDLSGGSSYFDPLLLHNGVPKKTKGWCSDVYTDAAIEFITRHRGQPFFAYVAFNAPHDPLNEVPRDEYETYRGVTDDKTARVYAMVANIDANVGRLMRKLDELNLSRDTIVVFLTDNGPAFPRFNSGMRGQKGTVYDGGVRVPCFIRWPGGLGKTSGARVDRVAAHVDLTPTLLEACGVPPPAGVKFDGKSLLPLLRAEIKPADWPDRTLYFQWHRGDVPQLHRAFAARSQRWKLVQPEGAGAKPFGRPRFELYDMATDPAETKDLSKDHPDIVESMKRGYEQWFADVTGTRDSEAPPRIVIGTEKENPVLLTRQDWRGPNAGWGSNDVGHWDLEVATAGEFEVTVHVPPALVGTVRSVRLDVGKIGLTETVNADESSVTFRRIHIPAGKTELKASVDTAEGKKGPRFVEVRRTRAVN
jgi:arylsulfatase A-like enzyme